MNKTNKRSWIRLILELIPAVLLLVGCFLIHTQQSILIETNIRYSDEDNENAYVVKSEENGNLVLTVPRSVEEYANIKFTSADSKVDVYPSILGMHFRHAGLEGKYDEGNSVYTYSLSKKYIRTNIMVLREYERLFLILTGIAFLVYGGFLLNCRETESGKFPVVLRRIFLILIAAAAVALNDGYTYLQTTFRNISVNELFFHFLGTNLEGANFTVFRDLVIRIAVHFAVILLVLALVLLIKKQKTVRNFFEKHHFIETLLYWLTVCALLLTCIYPVLRFYTYFNVFDYLASRKVPSEIFEKYYVDPAKVEITFPEKKKNLIYIYLESMEITSADKEHGGIEPVSTIPKLTELALENTAFNGSDTVLNGGVPLEGSTWTIAAMVAQSTGLPLKGASLTNQAGMLTNFMPGAVAIGDILEMEGYKNVLLLGSDAAFGNRDSFFGMHGNYEICDYNWAIAEGLIPKDYKEWWGYEDEKLFQYAKDKTTELAKAGDPFNLTLLTADTHYIDGYVCDLCGNEFDRKYANVIKCSDNQVSEFIEWIQEQPWAEDTVIVVSGDHLYMESEYFSNKPSDYQRKTYVTYINSEEDEPEKWKDFCTMDLFPTTLSAMGCTIEGERLGFGTNLYSEMPSLLDELGKAEFNEELDLYSKFYEDTIMMGK